MAESEPAVRCFRGSDSPGEEGSRGLYLGQSLNAGVKLLLRKGSGHKSLPRSASRGQVGGHDLRSGFPQHKHRCSAIFKKCRFICLFMCLFICVFTYLLVGVLLRLTLV